MPLALPEHRALVLNLRNPSVVTDVLPAKTLVHEGTTFTVVPHTVEVWRVLRNLGIKVDGFEPFRWLYKPPLVRGTSHPYAHQIETGVFLSSEVRGYCLSTPRTGKTASTLMAVDFLRQQKLVRSALVIAPASCLSSVWAAECFGMFPHWSIAVLQGSRAQRLKLLAQGYDLYVINPDGVKVIQKELLAAVTAKKINVIVVDEMTDYANRKSDRWTALNALGKKVDYMWGLTGTPGAPDDVYGQARLVTPDTVPDTYGAWRDRTMVQAKQVKKGVFTYVPRPGYEAHVSQALTPAIRFDKKDLMDLPPLQFLDVDCAMGVAQKEAYERMRRDLVLVAASGVSITAANAAVLTGKLMQIALGTVKNDQGGVTDYEMDERLEILERIISEAEYKVVIFAPYKAVLRRLQSHLRRRWTVELVDGSVTGAQRDKIFREFQAETHPQILAAHPRTVSFGLELSAADTIVFFGPPVNGPFVYQQAVERINSLYQKSKSPSVIHFSSSPAERALFKSIHKGVAVNETVVGLFNSIIQEAA